MTGDEIILAAMGVLALSGLVCVALILRDNLRARRRLLQIIRETRREVQL